MMRGIPQGASSPLLFNIYIDKLATDAEATRGAIRGDSAVTMLADDVLLQATTQHELQEMADVATQWQRKRGATWSVE